MSKKVLFFGDSLTYGDNPDPESLFGLGYSYVDILKNKYNSLEIVKCGQGGRTIASDDGKEGMNGYKSFEQILYSNFSFDYIFIMLGTNDLKNRFHLTAKDIAGQFVKYSEFLKLMQHKDYHKYTDTKVVLIAPPKIKEDWVPEDWGSEFTGTQAKSNSLKNEYVSIANQLGWGFIDTSRVKISNLDGIHLDDGGNKSIAKILETYFRDNIFTKDYVYSLDDWNSLKKEISDKKQFVEVRAGEIYWMHVGKNVGTEVDGKGEFFKRPVYVYKKLSKESFIGIPMTSKPKHGSWYKSVTFFNNRNNKNIGFCSLNQIKNFSVFRIVEKFGTVHYEERLKIKKSLGRLLGLF